MAVRTLVITPHGFSQQAQQQRYALSSTSVNDVKFALQKVQEAQRSASGLLAEGLGLLAEGLDALVGGRNDDASRYAQLAEARLSGIPEATSGLAQAALTVLQHHLSEQLATPMSKEMLHRYSRQLSEARQDTAGLPPEVARQVEGAFDTLIQCYALIDSGGDASTLAQQAGRQASQVPAGPLRTGFHAALNSLMGHLSASRPGGLKQHVNPDPAVYGSQDEAAMALSSVEVGNNQTDAFARQHAQGAVFGLADAQAALKEKRFGDAYRSASKARTCCKNARATRTQHPVITGAITRTEQELAGLPEQIRHAARSFHLNQVQSHRRKNHIAHSHLARAHQEIVQGIDAASTHPAGSKQTALQRATQGRQLGASAVQLGAKPEEFSKVEQAHDLIKQLADERFNR